MFRKEDDNIDQSLEENKNQSYDGDEPVKPIKPFKPKVSSDQDFEVIISDNGQDMTEDEHSSFRFG